MNYWGKVTSTINNMANNTLNGTEMATQLKRREKIIKEMEMEITTLRQNTQFANKAYEELELQKNKQEELISQFDRFSQKYVEAFRNIVQKIKNDIQLDVTSKIQSSLSEEIGEEMQTPEQLLQINLDCRPVLSDHLSSVFNQLKSSLEEEKSSKVKIQELEEKLEQQKISYQREKANLREGTQVITTELKSMLALEKENVKKIQNELNGYRIAQEKYQKQIYTKCEENNALEKQMKEIKTKFEEQISNFKKNNSKDMYEVLKKNAADVGLIKNELSELIGEILDIQIVREQDERNIVSNISLKIEQKAEECIEQIVRRMNDCIENNILSQNFERVERKMNLVEDKLLMLRKRACQVGIQKKHIRSETNSLVEQIQEVKCEYENKNQELEQRVIQSTNEMINVQSNASLELAKSQECLTCLKDENKQNQDLIQKYQEQMGILQQKINQVTKVNVKLSEETDFLKKQLEKIKLELEEALNSKDNFQKCSQKLKEENNSLQHIFQQKQTENLEQIQKHRSLLENLKQENSQKTTQIKQLKEMRKQEVEQSLVQSENKPDCLEKIVDLQKLKKQTLEKYENQKKRRELLEISLTKQSEEMHKIQGSFKQEKKRVQYLTNQVEQLKKENERIRKTVQDQYKQLEEDLKGVREEKERMKRKVTEYEDKNEILQKEKKLISSNLEKLRSDYELQISELNESFNKIKAEKNQANDELQLLKSMSQTLDQRYLELESKQAKLASEKTYLQLKVEENQLKLKEKNNQNQEFKTKYKQIQKQMKIYEEHAQSDEIQISEMKKSLNEAQKSLAQKNESYQNMMSQKQSLLLQMKKNGEKIQELSNLNKKLEGNQMKMEKQFNEVSSSLKISEQEKSQMGKRVKDQSENIQQLKRKNTSFQEQGQKLKLQSVVYQATQQKNLEQMKKKYLSEIIALHQAYKKEQQTLKNKIVKMQKNVSETAVKNNEMILKIKEQQHQILDYKSLFEKEELNGQEKKKEMNRQKESIRKLQEQLEKTLSQCTKSIEKERQNAKKEIAGKEDSYKLQKLQHEKKYIAELEKIKIQGKNKDSQIQQVKQKLLEQRKNSAMLKAKLDDMNKVSSKMEDIQIYSNQMKEKLLIKQQEIKKLFSNVQNLKTTISELEDGIETYQSYAEQKNQSLEQVNFQNEELTFEIKKMKEKNEQLIKRVQYQNKLIDATAQESELMNSPTFSKKQIIIPIKRLFLKYFQAHSSYEQKLQTLDTLCEVLGLEKEEQQIVKIYKKSKLSILSPDLNNGMKSEKKEALQDKFFEFLTSS